MVYIKGPLLLIKKSSLCGSSSGFPFLLSEWSFTVCCSQCITTDVTKAVVCTILSVCFSCITHLLKVLLESNIDWFPNVSSKRIRNHHRQHSLPLYWWAVPISRMGVFPENQEIVFNLDFTWLNQNKTTI